MKNLFLLFLILIPSISSFCQEETVVKSAAELRWDEISTQLETAFYAGDYQLAAEYGREAYDWALKNFDKDHLLIPNSLDNLGTVLHHAGRLYEAVPYLEQALKSAEEQLGKEHLDYLSRANNLAMLYKDLGYYQKAIPLFSEALDIVHYSYGKEHEYYGIFLNNQGLVFESMNLFDKAIENYEESRELTEKTYGKEHRKYAIRLSNLSAAYYSLGQYEKALVLSKESLRISEISLGSRHPSYANSLRQVANILVALGQAEMAVKYLEQTLSILDEKLGTDHIEYLISLQTIGSAYQLLGEQKKALVSFTKSMEINERIRGKNHPHALSIHNSLLVQLDLMQEFSACNEVCKKALGIQQNISQQYPYFSESEQLSLANSNRDLLNTIQSFSLKKPNKYEFNDLLYDSKLLRNGLALRNTERMLKTLRSQATSESVEMFEEWGNLKKVMAKQYSLPILSRDAKFDSLERKCNELESELARRSTDFQTLQQQISWRDVQAQLKDGEVAIEFSHFKYIENSKSTDSIFYVAYLLKKDGNNPLMIPLFEEKDLGNINKIRSLYAYQTDGTPNLKALVFDPLAAELKDINTIYYASSGLLHRLNLQAIPFSANEILADHFEMHKLSSTRQIAIKESSIMRTENQAVLYGGIQYESNTTLTDSLLSDDASKTQSIGAAFRSLRQEDWDYLEWTNEEVKVIGNSLRLANFEVIQQQADQATEEHFKQLNDQNKSPRILHFATHAYFFPDTESTNYTTNAFEASKHPMIRSGLILSGANQAWRGEDFSSDEDGILTAYEIAQMDLSNTELVVLSACDTGLGDINDSEGVFGLQRAFKIAGVKNIIMSLWSVKDKQTHEFMSDFYQLWLNSDNQKTIPEAFQQAQLNLKNKYTKPFNPFLWAGFILME